MNPTITPFDFHRIFIGSIPPIFMLEIIFRVIIIYCFAVFVLHFMGKRGSSQLTPLEYVVIIAMGSAAGDPMFYPEIPLMYAFIVITILVGVNQLIAHWKEKIPFLSKLIESEPKIIVKNGKLKKKVLERENFSKKEVFSRLREKNIRFLEEVETAIIEESGKLSVFTKKKYSAQTDLTKPENL